MLQINLKYLDRFFFTNKALHLFKVNTLYILLIHKIEQLTNNSLDRYK